jgi:GNAT superfamily N-acetyltransferase
MSVRRATPGDEPTVRSLRLQALSDSPDAFDSTLEREIARTTSEWQKWISDGATFILERPDGPKGLAAGVPHWTEPTAVFLMAMWVHSELRGTGAADALVAAVLAWAEAEGAADVWLHVGKRNDRARRLYERNGFRLTGNEIVRELDGLVEVEMRCALSRSGASRR